jgi:3-dehydroquinate synthase
MTNGEIRHGEAVAIGIALDSLYSRRLGLIADLDLYKIMAVLEDVGFELYHPALKWLDVKKAVEEFREHLGGIISIPLLSGIGNKIEAHEINLELYRQAIAALGERHPLRNKTSFPVAGGTRARL